MTPFEIYREIVSLNARELRTLRRLLGDLADGLDEGGSGVREPRKPGPMSFPPSRKWRGKAT